MQAVPVLEQEFLPLRAKLLEVAAALDRFDRSEEVDRDEPRLKKIRTAIEILLTAEGGRAEQVQIVFSREYEDDWRAKFGLAE